MVSTEPFFIWKTRLTAVIFLSPTIRVCLRSLHLTACSGLRHPALPVLHVEVFERLPED